MASKLVKCPEALYSEASKLAQERGISIGSALELMVSRGNSASQPMPSTSTDQTPQQWAVIVG
jgi:hypothetical protein